MEIIASNRGKCPDEEKNPTRLNANFTRVGLNKYSINGTLEVDKDIFGKLLVCKCLPTNFSNSINQLLFSMKRCRLYTSDAIPLKLNVMTMAKFRSATFVALLNKRIVFGAISWIILTQESVVQLKK